MKQAGPEERPSREAAGYAFEAAPSRSRPSILATQYKSDPRLSGPSWSSSSSRAANGARRPVCPARATHVSRGDPLRGPRSEETPSGGLRGRRSSRPVSESSRAARDPPLLLPAPARGRRTPAAVQPPRLLPLRLPGFRSSSGRARSPALPIQERVERAGTISHGEAGGEIPPLSPIPGRSRSRILQARNTRVGVPWHRVIAPSRRVLSRLRGSGGSRRVVISVGPHGGRIRAPQREPRRVQRSLFSGRRAASKASSWTGFSSGKRCRSRCRLTPTGRATS